MSLKETFALSGFFFWKSDRDLRKSSSGADLSKQVVDFRQRGVVFENDSHYHGMQRIAVPPRENWALNTATVVDRANRLPESAEPENASAVFVRPSHDPRPSPS